jgi:hypothetical protein
MGRIVMDMLKIFVRCGSFQNYYGHQDSQLEHPLTFLCGAFFKNRVYQYNSKNIPLREIIENTTGSIAVETLTPLSKHGQGALCTYS